MPTDVIRKVWLTEKASNYRMMGTLRRPVAADDVIEAERTWKPVRDRHADHGHWEWDRPAKLRAAADGRTAIVGVTVGADWQGLMSVTAAPQPSRHRLPIVGRLLRRPVLYVDYIESAPWNDSLLVPASRLRFAGVGTVLLAEAVRMSVAAGLNGRVGLHSLPRSETFYFRRGMDRRLRSDAEKEGLAYFEYNSRTARAFLATNPGN